jgi:hypothetical protein
MIRLDGTPGATRGLGAFFAYARTLVPDPAQATAQAVFLVAPDGFQLAEQSASDNRYMDLGVGVDPARALDQHRGLRDALTATLPTLCFPGDPRTPDAIFPNNVFATVAARDGRPAALVLGHMRHPVRQAERERADIRAALAARFGYVERDLGAQPGVCELTGSLVIDHARRIGYCGLGERCDEAGARAMHEAFGLRATLLFDLAPGEYHTNVVLAVLAGRACVVAPDGFADPAVPAAIAELYAPHAVVLAPAQKHAFAGNCIAITGDAAWMSAAAAAALDKGQRVILADAGFAVRAIALDELEKAGGSLRCCVAELF